MTNPLDNADAFLKVRITEQGTGALQNERMFLGNAPAPGEIVNLVYLGDTSAGEMVFKLRASGSFGAIPVVQAPQPAPPPKPGILDLSGTTAPPAIPLSDPDREKKIEEWKRDRERENERRMRGKIDE